MLELNGQWDGERGVEAAQLQIICAEHNYSSEKIRLN